MVTQSFLTQLNLGLVVVFILSAVLLRVAAGRIEQLPCTRGAAGATIGRPNTTYTLANCVVPDDDVSMIHIDIAEPAAEPPPNGLPVVLGDIHVEVVGGNVLPSLRLMTTKNRTIVRNVSVSLRGIHVSWVDVPLVPALRSVLTVVGTGTVQDASLSIVDCSISIRNRNEGTMRFPIFMQLETKPPALLVPVSTGISVFIASSMLSLETNSTASFVDIQTGAATAQQATWQDVRIMVADRSRLFLRGATTSAVTGLFMFALFAPIVEDVVMQMSMSTAKIAFSVFRVTFFGVHESTTTSIFMFSPLQNGKGLVARIQSCEFEINATRISSALPPTAEEGVAVTLLHRAVVVALGERDQSESISDVLLEVLNVTLKAFGAGLAGVACVRSTPLIYASNFTIVDTRAIVTSIGTVGMDPRQLVLINFDVSSFARDIRMFISNSVLFAFGDSGGTSTVVVSTFTMSCNISSFAITVEGTLVRSSISSLTTLLRVNALVTYAVVSTVSTSIVCLSSRSSNELGSGLLLVVTNSSAVGRHAITANVEGQYMGITSSVSVVSMKCTLSNSTLLIANSSALTQFAVGAFKNIPHVAATRLGLNMTAVLLAADAGNVVVKMIPEGLLGIVAGLAVSLFQTPALFTSVVVAIHNASASVVFEDPQETYAHEAPDITTVVILPPSMLRSTVTIITSPHPPASAAVPETRTDMLVGATALGSAIVTSSTVTITRTNLSSFLGAMMGNMTIIHSSRLSCVACHVRAIPTPNTEGPSSSSSAAASVIWAVGIPNGLRSYIIVVEDDNDRITTTHRATAGVAAAVYLDQCEFFKFRALVQQQPTIALLRNSSDEEAVSSSTHAAAITTPYFVLSLGCNLWDGVPLPATVIGGALELDVDVHYPPSQFDPTRWCALEPVPPLTARRSDMAAGAAVIVAAMVAVRQLAVGGGGAGGAHALQTSFALLQARALCLAQVSGEQLPVEDDVCCDASSSPLGITAPVGAGTGPYAGAVVGNSAIVLGTLLARVLCGWVISWLARPSNHSGRFSSVLMRLRSAAAGGSVWALLWPAWVMLLCPTIAGSVVLMQLGGGGGAAIALGITALALWCAPWAVSGSKTCVTRSCDPRAQVAPRKRFPFYGIPTRRVRVTSMHERWWHWLMQPSEQLGAGRGQDLRDAHDLLRAHGPAFTSYVATRYWYFNVELGFAFASGTVMGFGWIEATSAPCSVLTGWLLVVIGVAEGAAALYMQPFLLRLDLVTLLCVNTLSVLSEVIALTASSEAGLELAAGLGLVASLVTFCLFIMGLIDVVCFTERSNPLCARLWKTITDAAAWSNSSGWNFDVLLSSQKRRQHKSTPKQKKRLQPIPSAAKNRQQVDSSAALLAAWRSGQKGTHGGALETVLTLICEQQLRKRNEKDGIMGVHT